VGESVIAPFPLWSILGSMPLFFARALFVLLLAVSFPVSLQAAAPSILDRLRETTLSVQMKPLDLGAIPQGAQRVSFLSLEFTASCDGDVRIREIHAHHFGLGKSSDIKGVYLLKDMERITKSAPLSASGQTVNLRTKGLRIAACEKIQLSIAADFSADADIGSEHRFDILSADDIVTDADKLTAPKFPLRNLRRTSTSVTPLPAGKITVTFLPLSGSVSPGADRTLAKFQLAADNQSHHLLYSLMLTNDGSAKDGDLRSLYLTRKSGKALTQVALSLDGKEVLLSFSRPYLLKRGEKIAFELRGRTFTTRETIKFILKEPSDLNALPLRGGRRLGE